MASIPRPHPVRHVAIVGAGFSGTLQAIDLIRQGGPRVTLIERRDTPARGLAYSAAHPDHLLNVRAANMSALPDDPDHFLRWLAEHHPQITGFAPRLVYGRYLEGLLAAARREHRDRIAVRQGEVIDIVRDGAGFVVAMADGAGLAADAVILAPGNLPPHEPAILAAAALDADRHVADPWSTDIAHGLADTDTVLAIGSGLTMVDVALLLRARGFGGRLIALSRRGLLPHAHATGGAAAPGLAEPPAARVTTLVRAVRRRAAQIGWRPAVDELRPHTQAIWQAADAAERRRFLRHLRPWWDVHRHRLAPEVAARIAALRATGRLEVAAGRLESVQADGSALTVTWRPRGSDLSRCERVRRIVNCSGPLGDLGRTDDRLLRNLLDAGTIRPDALHVGIDVNGRSEVIDARGRCGPGLLAIGPPTRGTFWEIVAVPDIRVQAWAIAARLAAMHRAGGATA